MSKPESLDLSAEDLMPAWVSGLENPTPPTPTAKYERDDNRDQRKGQRGGSRDGRRNDRGGGGYGNDDRRQGGRGRNDRSDRNRGGHDRHRENRQPMRAEDIVPQVDFVVEPTVEAVKALAKHIRSTNRAYAMAEVAQMVLAAEDRYRVIFRVKSEKRSEAKETSKPSQSQALRLVRCKSDGSVWLSREEAVAHFLNTPELLEELYEVEVVSTEAPKGNFSVIAVCGLSGTILGPPNHHEYQLNIASLHRERFGNMPLEKFKSRIEMRRDEETIEQWKEQKSTSKHYRVRAEKPEPVIEETAAAETGAEAPAEGIPETLTDVSDSPEENAPATGEGNPAETAAELSDETTDAEHTTEQTDESGTETTAPDASTQDESAETDEGEALSTGEDTPIESEEESPPLEGSAEAEPAITSMVELTRHFREHFARRIFKEVGEVRLPGSVSKKELSSALRERMNAEINWQKRGFPLPMVRTLCRKFEHQGLKFFKRGEKTLYVSASRPRALAKETVLTDRLVLMLNHIKEKPGTLAGDLIKHLQGNTASAAKETQEAPSEPSKKELALLADLRWLLAEGYLIEFPNSELIPGTDVSADKRKRRPAKRSKKKRPAKKNPTTEIKAEDSKPDSTTSSEPPVPKVSETGESAS